MNWTIRAHRPVATSRLTVAIVCARGDAGLTNHEGGLPWFGGIKVGITRLGITRSGVVGG